MADLREAHRRVWTTARLCLALEAATEIAASELVGSQRAPGSIESIRVRMEAWQSDRRTADRKKEPGRQVGPARP